jgi:predicted TIM-barrel fold metal-dependent hydrolase
MAVYTSEEGPSVMSDFPWIISVDDHVVEPKDVWLRWLPERFRDRGPRVVEAPYEWVPEGRFPFRLAAEGPSTDWWVYGEQRAPIMVGSAAAGRSADEIDYMPTNYGEMRPGYYDRKARLADMDLNHVERSLCFPTFPRFCGQVFLWGHDRELDLACVEAFNNWMVEEWCADSGGRLIPLCLIPLWDPELAAAEVRRNAARGVRAVTFTELPSALGLPSLHDRDRHWDPFLAACEETGTVINIHIGSSSQVPTTSPDAPKGIQISLGSINSQLSLTDWLLSAVLIRFPGLKVAFSEAQIGWMPYVLERLDTIFTKGNKVMGLSEELTVLPSEQAKGRIYGCVFEDTFGISVRDQIGIDQICFEVDYPHQDGTWPNSKDYAEQAMAGLSENEIYKIIRGNAIDLLGLPATLG